MKKLKAFVVALVFFTVFLTGCANNKATFTQKNYTSNDAEVTAVVIDVKDRIIDISLSTDSLVHIDYFESEKEFYDISVSEDNVLTMVSKNNKKWLDYIGSKPNSSVRKISIQIPNNYLSKLTLSTTNEDINIPKLSVLNDIIVIVNGGDIVFDEISVGSNLKLTAKNGNITGFIVGGYDDFAITSKIKKGKNNLPAEKKGGNKKLEVTNNNGNINIEFVK